MTITPPATTTVVPTPTVTPTVTTKRAAIYLRVSTPRQARKNNEAEGYSIPQQREYCQRRARELGAEVIREYVDAGESARGSDREGLQSMLADMQSGDADRGFDYIIVHKLDRLIRDRSDDMALLIAMKKARTELVSVSEAVDASPAGQLLQGVMASINQYYSDNLSLEAKKGMAQKAKNGGTHGVAPIGYLNTLSREGGQEVKGVAVDADRAPHITWAFQVYATGDGSISTLAEALEARGLRGRVTQKYRGTPLSTAQLHRMLKNPYYTGKIVYQGIVMDGAHPGIVDAVVWQRCQDILADRRLAGDRSWKLSHALKGCLVCGRCGGRMGYGKSRGQGGIYDYFFCLGRHTGRTDCDLPYIGVEKVEAAVRKEWRRRAQLSPRELACARTEATAQLDAYVTDSAAVITQQTSRLAVLNRRKQ